MLSKSDIQLMRLFQSGLSSSSELSSLKADFDWESLLEKSVKQGVLAIAFDGIQKLSKEQMPTQKLLMEWYGRMLFTEKLYAQHTKYTEGFLY